MFIPKIYRACKRSVFWFFAFAFVLEAAFKSLLHAISGYVSQNILIIAVMTWAALMITAVTAEMVEMADHTQIHAYHTLAPKVLQTVQFKNQGIMLETDITLVDTGFSQYTMLMDIMLVPLVLKMQQERLEKDKIYFNNQKYQKVKVTKKV